jgi:hypothetical protein
MGLPRITFNSKNVDFTKDVAEFTILPVRARLRNESASGKSETLNMASGFSVTALIRNLKNSDATEGDLKTALYELMQWAEDGQSWVFNRDRDVTVNTTLDSAAVAGATSIPVASATGIVSGSRYAIESLMQVAIVEASNSATDPVTITVALNYAFASGARFRAFEYLPMLGNIRISEHTSGMFYDVEIVGTVDKSALTV